MKRAQERTLIAVAAVTLLMAACAKRQVATALPPPPAPPPPAAVAAPAPEPVPPPPAPPAPTATTRPPEAAGPAPRYPSAATRARIDELLAKIEDAYFDYDQATLRPDALKTLQANATELRDILKDFPDFKLTVEGHCDERGSAEYNIALGDQRARAAKDYLVQVGIPSAQLNVVSYGNERPACQEHNESCWQRNRRVHFVAMDQPH